MIKIDRLFDFPYYQQEQYPLQECLITKYAGKWTPISTSQFIDKANALSCGLIALGLQPNNKVAVITTTNRTEWNITDIGILQTGAQNVPIYPTLSDQELEYVLNHSESVYCFVSCEGLFLRIERIKNRLPYLKEIYSFDEIDGCKNWRELLKSGNDQSLQITLQKRKNQIKTDDLATLIYTSGTTGIAKGVMLSHKNIVSNIVAVAHRVPSIPQKSRALSFLPLCHIYERMMSYMYMYSGVGIFYAESLENLGDNAREIHPDLMTAVPRLMEKVYDKIIAKGAELKGPKRLLFNWALHLGLKYEPYGVNGFWYELQLWLANRVVFNKWRAALGGNIKAISSGGAALQPRLARVFNAAGIRLYEGYGLTETSPVISVNEYPNHGMKIGTVGKILDHVEVKIAEDGEVLVKGDLIMMGYYKEPEKTAQVMTNEFFHTGDIGEIDSDGFLKITDRKKEIFKTSGGKYVAPQRLENLLKQSPFIEQVMVVGEGEKMPAALIQADFEFLERWATEHQIRYANLEALLQDATIIDRIQQEVDKVNHELSKWETIKQFRLTSDIWSVNDGHLTPKLSLRRKVIKEKYLHLYNDIYQY